jgi:hypothetical protein
MMQTQLPQFPEPAWSTTKQSCYEACPRQYYFQSYASWQGWPKGSKHSIQENRHAYFWSKRETIPTWKGKLIHSAVSKLLLGESADEVSRTVSSILRKEWRWSTLRGEKLRELGVDECREPKQILLMEHTESAISDEIADELEEKVQESIMTFSKLDILSEFREIAQRDDRYSFVENADTGFKPRKVEFIDPQSGQPLVVWSMIDCAYEIEPGTCLVYDWKTGRIPPDAEETRLTDQLIVYAHYVRNQVASKGSNRDVQVEAFELYLPEGKAFGGHITAGDLEDARDRVVTQAAKLLEIHELVREQGKTACEATPSEGVCRHCSFRKMCDMVWKIEE